MNKTRKLTIRPLASAVCVAAVSLMCLVSANVSAITVTTTNGNGADVQLTGWTGPDANPSSAADTASNNDQMNIRQTTNRNEVLAMRVDLTGYTLANNTGYTIQLVNQRANSAGTLNYYAVTDGTVGEDNNGSTPGYTDNNWSESSVVFSTMPGLHWANTSTASQTVNGNVVSLGSASMNATAEGSVVTFTSQALIDFMQTNADNQVTFLILRTDNNNSQARFASKEATVLASGGTGNAGDYAPSLKFSAIGCDPAAVSTPPASQTVIVGNTANFTVVATGSTPTYQWQVKTNGTTTWFNISGATADNYTTPATTTGDSGNQYRVLVSVSCDTDTAISAAATLTVQALANWTGGASPNTDWTAGANWDTGVAPGSGTNAQVGTGFTIAYATPALAYKSLTNSSTINISAAGFSNTFTFCPVAGGVLNVNNGGVMSVGGDLALYLGSGISLSPGGTLNATRLVIGSSATGGTGTGASNFGRVTNNGGILIASSTMLNPGNGNQSTTVGTDASPLLMIKGGTNRLGAVSIQRLAGSTSAANTLGRDGVIISNGIVEMTSLSVGNNAHGTALVAGGAVTNSGATIVTNATSGRPARFLQTGGIYVGGGVLAISPSGSGDAIASITGGTNFVAGLQFGGGAATGTTRFTNATAIYIGSSGIGYNGAATIQSSLNQGGLFGAQVDWTGAAPLALAGAYVFQAAAADGTAHNIGYNAALGGTGPLVKTGTGVLSLNGTNGYTAVTLINQGTLALGANGSLGSSAITVGSNTVFDVSAVTGGYAVPASKTLGGWGSVNGNVTIASGGIVDPGTNASNGTLTFSNSLIETGGGKTFFNLTVNPVGPGNDLIVINNDLNVSGVSNIVQITGGGPAGSVHPLFKYSGTFNGNLTNFVVSGATGVLTNDTSTTPKMIAFRVQATVRAATNVVWVGNAVANTWNTVGATNWLNGAALDYFVSGDNALFNSAGAANPNVNIAGSVAPGSLTVNATTSYTFDGLGSIDGATSLTKTNSGRLTINNTNLFTGGVNFKGGTVSVANLAADGVASPLGQSGTLTLDGGALEYTGGTTTWSRNLTVGTNGGALSVTNGATVLTQSGQLVGTGVLTKSGSGTLTLNNVANFYSGGTVVSNGTLAIEAAAAAGSGPISLGTGAILSVGSPFKPANPIVILGPSIITGGNNAGSNGVAAISGSADVVVSIKTGVFDLIGTMTNYSGTMTLSNAGGASLRFQGTTGSSLATFDLGVGTMDLMVRNSLQSVDIGGLKGGASTTLSGRGGASNNGPTTHNIGANNTDTTFDGVIQNGSGGGSSTTAIVKTGTGKLSLTGASTYTGSTTVSNGTLQVDGSLASPTVTVEGGVLGGSGTLSGSVTVNANGTIAPGASVGTLTVNSSVTLNPGSTNNMEIDAGNATNDLLVVAGAITYGGTLNVTNLSGSLAAGQVYKLFSAADEFSYIGSFDGGTNLPPLGFGLAWDTTGLATNGTISIYSAVTVNPSRTNITFTAGGGNLTISWPLDHTGWTLQTQTNSRSVGLNTNWFNVAGSSATNQVTVPITQTTPTVFYRLNYFIP